ncbi:MAG: hypothetical protein DRP95_03600 [Candidatus Latescibacterota bacterium]|nr:MAG: hypothetical protein DRP95_03600 [Candidatus Latescibacterota bacterium]
MGDLGEFGLMALSTLFAIVDPVGAVPAFLVMTQGDAPRSRTARTAALSIAGGIVPFGISLNMLKVQPSRVMRTPEEVGVICRCSEGRAP